jgi:zinc transport system ATP-binding protein
VSSAKTLPTSAPLSHAGKILIDVDNLTAVYNADPVLQEVSFCIHRGEFIGLIGPNGAGKTTLLRTVLGLAAPTTGTVRRGQAAIGYVPQRQAAYSGTVPISVAEVVALGANGNREAAAQAIARVRLEAYAHRRFTDLSGGQQQRVSIAKALAGGADVLILDEPAAGIDEHSQTEFYDLLKNLQALGVTIVMVSHEVDVVLKLVTRVICLNHTILYDGPPKHFEADKYLPRAYQLQHVRLHHQHGDDHA